MAELDLSEVDIEEVLKRLTLRAIRLFSTLAALPADGIIQGIGMQPADLAIDTLVKFLDPAEPSVAWSNPQGKPTTRGVIGFLKKVMENDLRDLLSTKAHETTVIVEPLSMGAGDDDGAPRRMSLDDFAVEYEGQDGRAIRVKMQAWLLRRLEDAPELRDVLAAQLDPEEYQAYTNQELATLLALLCHKLTDSVDRGTIESWPNAKCLQPLDSIPTLRAWGLPWDTRIGSILCEPT